MSSRSFILTILISLLFCTSFLRPHFTFSQAYNFDHYDISDGLSHDVVVDICEDKYGNLWIATMGGGLSMYNGVEFKNFTIREGILSNYVRDVIQDHEGNLWVATAAGISKYNGKEFINYQPTKEENENSISVLHQDNSGRIWFATSSGDLGALNVNMEPVDSISIVYPNNANDRIIDIETDADGNVWFVSVLNGLLKFDGKQFTNELTNSDINGFLLSIFVDDGVLKLCTNKGIANYNPKTPPREIDFIEETKNVFIKKVVKSKNGEVWAISGAGAVQLNDNGFQQYDDTEGFSDRNVNVLYFDREGTLWAGTDGDGVYKLNNQVFQKFDERHGLSDTPITSVVQDNKDQYWVTTYGEGLSIYSGDSIQRITLDNGLPSNYLTCSVSDNEGSLYFGTRGSGLIKYSGDEYIQMDDTDGLIFNNVRCLFVNSNNQLFIGTSNGLSIFENGKYYNYNNSNGLSDNIIWNISEPSPGRTMVTTRSGIIYFEEGNIVSKIERKDLFDKRVNIALEDQLGNIWLGYSGHGLTYLNRATGELQTITSLEGLSSNLIYNMLLLEDGSLMVGSERSVDIIYFNDEHEIDWIRNYGQIEGFSSISTLHNSFFQDVNNDVWIGSPNGLFKFSNSKNSRNQTEPIIYISGLKLFYSEVDWSQYTDEFTEWLGLPVNPRLPYDQNNLVIDYFGNSLSNPKDVHYQFRLIGLENDWSPVTDKREAVYTNLSPGEYTFEVKSTNSDGIWSLEPARFSFVIIRPFWQEIWFYALCIVMFLLGLKLFNDYRIHKNLQKALTIERIRTEEQIKVRKVMARDFHDNMGNQLASINVFTNLINLKLKDKSDEIDALLKNIEKHTKSLFNGTKDFIWSMDPESDNLEEVYTYIRDFGEELFEKTKIDFYAEKEAGEILNFPLTSGWSRQLVLIFKEAMTNSLKHSEADKVYLKLNLKDQHFVLTFKDNGKGLNKNKNSGGYGLQNMQSRATQINCRLTVNQDHKGGTVVTLEGNLNGQTTTL